MVNKTLYENACELEWVVLYFKEDKYLQTRNQCEKIFDFLSPVKLFTLSGIVRKSALIVESRNAEGRGGDILEERWRFARLASSGLTCSGRNQLRSFFLFYSTDLQIVGNSWLQFFFCLLKPFKYDGETVVCRDDSGLPAWKKNLKVWNFQITAITAWEFHCGRLYLASSWASLAVSAICRKDYVWRSIPFTEVCDRSIKYDTWQRRILLRWCHLK